MGTAGRLWRPSTLVVGLALIPVVGTVVLTGLNHDVRYALGGLRVSPASPAETFVHRPLVYRWLLAALDVVSAGPWWLGEAVIRVVALFGVLGAAVLLRRGLATRLSTVEATSVAAGVGLALALAPNWDFLQPEWVACVASAAAIGAALLPRRLVVCGAGAGVLLVCAALVKFTTASTALIALGVLVVLDRRRAVAAAVGAAVAGAAFLVLVVFAVPREWQWLRELPVLNPPSPLGSGLSEAYARAALASVANEAVLVPLLAVLPAAVVMLARLATTRRARLAWLVLPPAAVLVAVLPLAWQAQWFLYHLAVLPGLAAGICALAVARWTRAGRSPLPLAIGTAVAGVGAMAALGAPLSWRLGHGTLVFGGLGVLAAACLGWALLSRSARVAAGSVVLCGLAGVIALTVPVAPGSGYSFDVRHADYTNTERRASAQRQAADLAAARDRIGADAPVLYLAFGDAAYFLGNPTPCDYPSATWVQRSSWLPQVRATASYRENVDCLSEPAEYLLLDRRWIAVDRLEPSVGAMLSERFDCGGAFEADHLLVCRGRP